MSPSPSARPVIYDLVNIVDLNSYIILSIHFWRNLQWACLLTISVETHNYFWILQ